MCFLLCLSTMIRVLQPCIEGPAGWPCSFYAEVLRKTCQTLGIISLYFFSLREIVTQHRSGPGDGCFSNPLCYGYLVGLESNFHLHIPCLNSNHCCFTSRVCVFSSRNRTITQMSNDMVWKLEDNHIILSGRRS